MEKTLEINVEESWNQGLESWSYPSIPKVIPIKTQEELQSLGLIGQVLSKELAFMKYPEFQTYMNLENILKEVPENPERAVKAILKHEIGHRFMPYDIITSLILAHNVKKSLGDIPYDKESATKLIMNLFADMCINTRSARSDDKDITWLYEELSKTKDTPLWKVYGKSMELAWNTKILPENLKLEQGELDAAKELSQLFNDNYFMKDSWARNIREYTSIISKFLKNEDQDKKSQLDDISENMPEQLDEKTTNELVKRLAELGSDGLPKNAQGLKEFKEMMAGFGQGDAIKASIQFYNMLSGAYNVMFATKPFGKPKKSPMQPIKWTPSMGVENLDVNYSAQLGGRLIPGVNTYGWLSRKREHKQGEEEIVPNLDIYLDSSYSMPNPTEEISLPVLSAFVVAKKAHKKGAKIRSTNFSGSNQYKTVDFTNDLQAVFENFVTYYKGGTVFPVKKLLETGDPKQALIITDSFIGNEEEVANSIQELRARHKGNKVTVYALHPVPEKEYFEKAGAEVISGTTADIFRKSIGKLNEVYKI